MIRARAVVIATGAQYRRLGVDEVESFVGRGVYYGAAMSIAQGLRGQRAYVVGGGNSAGQAALHLARFASAVTILVRRHGLEETMSDYLIREIAASPRISVRGRTEVVGASGDGRLASLQLRDVDSGEVQRVRAGALMLLLGAEACTGWLPAEVATDERSFVLTGRDIPQALWAGELPPVANGTSVPGVFAAGDVRSGSMKRVASSSGDGASVVPLVHEYLAELAE